MESFSMKVCSIEFYMNQTRVKFITIIKIIIIPQYNTPLRAQTCQPTAGITFAHPQEVVNDKPASLGVILCWIYSPRILLQISSYPNSSSWWVGTDPIQQPKIIFHRVWKQHSITQYQFKAHALNRETMRPGHVINDKNENPTKTYLGEKYFHNNLN